MSAVIPKKLCSGFRLPEGGFGGLRKKSRSGFAWKGLPGPPSSRRRAALTVELILTLPVFLILLAAVVQFGLYHVRMQHVALASRIGAALAAQTSSLPSSGAVPTAIVQAVEAELQSAGISQFCIRLEHNVGVPPGNPPLVLLSGECGGCTIQSLNASPYGQYVRLSVCVPLTQLMPNVLKVFGFDLTGKTTAFTTVFRYEL